MRPSLLSYNLINIFAFRPTRCHTGPRLSCDRRRSGEDRLLWSLDFDLLVIVSLAATHKVRHAPIMSMSSVSRYREE